MPKDQNVPTATQEENRDFHIHVLKEGGFTLSCGPGEDYGYDTVDELLEDLRSDLQEVSGGSDESDDGSAERKAKVKKIMQGDDSDEN